MQARAPASVGPRQVVLTRRDRRGGKPRTAPGAERSTAPQIRQSERLGPVAAEPVAEHREQGGICADRERDSVADRPAAGGELKPEWPDLADQRRLVQTM